MIIVIEIGVFILFTAICGIVVYVGLDLKKLSSWLYVLAGFGCGFVEGVLVSDLRGGFKLGALGAFAVLYSGAMTRWQRRNFKK